MLIKFSLAGFLLMFILWILTGCTKKADGITGATGPDGIAGSSVSETRSAITGYVKLIDQFGYDVSIYDSVNVSTTAGDSLISSVTDQAGKFSLPSLKSGTYRILFRRPRYDSLAVTVNHTAGDLDQFAGLIQMDESLTTHFLSQTFQYIVDPFNAPYKDLQVTMTCDGPPLYFSTVRYYSIFFSRSPAVSDHNFLIEYDGYTHNEGTNQFVTGVYFAASQVTQLIPGDTLYMKSYFVPAYSLSSSWFDTNTYQLIAYPYKGDSLQNYFIWSN